MMPVMVVMVVVGGSVGLGRRYPIDLHVECCLLLLMLVSFRNGTGLG